MGWLWWWKGVCFLYIYRRGTIINVKGDNYGYEDDDDDEAFFCITKEKTWKCL